jgi:DNA-binding transcriptional LysR family regulator
MALGRDKLPLDLLRRFHEIAAQGGLCVAAQRLHLTPSAITHSLTRLEALVGHQLCVRGRAGFHLTSVGEELHRATRRTFAELDAVFQTLQGERDFSGTLRVGVLTNLASRRFDAAFEVLLRKFPRARIALVNSDANTLTRHVLANELHFAAGVFFTRWPRKLAYEFVEKQPFSYYIGRGHPLWRKRRVVAADLVGCEVIWLGSEMPTISGLEAEIFEPRPHYKMRVTTFSNTIEGALRIMLSGRAVAPLPREFMDRHIRSHPGTARRLNVATNAPAFAVELLYNPTIPLAVPLRQLVASLKCT